MDKWQSIEEIEDEGKSVHYIWENDICIAGDLDFKDAEQIVHEHNTYKEKEKLIQELVEALEKIWNTTTDISSLNIANDALEKAKEKK